MTTKFDVVRLKAKTNQYQPPYPEEYVRTYQEMSKIRKALDNAQATLLLNGLSHNAIEIQKHYVEELQTEYQQALEKYRAAEKEYREIEAQINGLFQKEAIEACGLNDHPLAEKAFFFAWNKMSGNHYDTLIFLGQLADDVLLAS